MSERRDLLIRRLQEPPFGTETSERNLMLEAFIYILELEAKLNRLELEAHDFGQVKYGLEHAENGDLAQVVTNYRKVRRRALTSASAALPEPPAQEKDR